jgi:hypothetical protein
MAAIGRHSRSVCDREKRTQTWPLRSPSSPESSCVYFSTSPGFTAGGGP